MIARTACVVLVLVATALGDEPPTQDQLQKLADEKNWAELMKATTRVLQLKGPAAEPYDRPAVWQLKAEAQLQENMFVAAAESFEDATREPTIDPAIKDRCAAMSKVMRKTDARGFGLKSRKPGATETIDVKDPANRPAALKALFDFQIGEVKADIDRQKKKPSLNDLVKIAREARDLPPLERAATQSEEQTRAVVEQAGKLMAESIDKWMETSRVQMDKIRASANEMVEVETRRDGPRERRDPAYRKRGLNSKDTSELKAIVTECKRIAAAYKSFVEAAGKPSADLEAIPPRVDAVYKEAQNILDADYS